MKEENQIDQLFKKGVEQSFPFDEKLWQAVEPQLPTPSGTPWFLNLNSIALILVLFCCSLIPKDNSYKQISHSNSAHHENSINEPIKNGKVIRPNATEEHIVPKSNQNTKTIKTTSSPNTNSTNTTLSTYELKESDKPESLTNELENITSSTNSEVLKIKTAAKKTKDLAVQKDQKVYSQLPLSSLNNKTSYVENKKENDYSADNFKSLITLSKVESNGLSSFSFNYSLSPKSTEKMSPPKTYFSKYYLEFEGYTSFRLDKEVKSKESDFTNYKNENESSISFQTAGINYVKQYKKLTYGLGIQLNQYKESVSYTLQKDAIGYDVRFDTSYQVINDSYNSNGIPVLLITQNITELRNPKVIQVDDLVQVDNTFSRVRLPVFIGYTKKLNNWQAELRASFITGYLFGQEGLYINNDLVSIQNFETNNQLKELTFSHSYQLSIGYAVNELTAVGIRAYYENDLNSFTNEYESRLSSQNVGIWIAIKP